MLDVHSSWILSPDLNIVPELVEEVMESLPRTLVLNREASNTNNMLHLILSSIIKQSVFSLKTRLV